MERSLYPGIKNKRRQKIFLAGLFFTLALTLIGCRYDSYSSQQKVFDTCTSVINPEVEQPDSSVLPMPENVPKVSSPLNDFCMGIQEFRLSNFSIARQYFEASQSDFLELKDYVLFYLARCLEELGEHQQAILMFLTLLEEFPQSRFAARVKLRVADNFFFLEDYKVAREYYQKSIDELPQEKEYIYFQMALSLIEEEKWIEAQDFLKKIFIRFPTGEYAELSELYLREMESDIQLKLPAFSETDHVEIIESLMGEGQYEKALSWINRLQAGSPSSGSLTDLLYREAYCYSKVGRKDKALQMLNNLVKLNPTSESALKSLLLAGNILWNQDKDAEAIEIYQKIIKTFNHGPGLHKAWYYLGRIYEQNRKYKRAIKCFEKVVQGSTHGKYYSESLWRIGWAYYQWGKFQKAEVHFGNCLSKIDDRAEKHLFLYWQGRSAEKNLDLSKAKQLYQNILSDSYYSYYSWCALKRVDEWSIPPLEFGQQPVEVSEASFTDDISFHLSRARKLLEYQLTEEAAEEIKLLTEINYSNPHYWYNLGKMALDVGLYRQVVLAGYRCQQLFSQRDKTWSDAEVLQLLYPLAYWDHIQKHAGRYGIDPLLVCALMRQESLFDPLSLSTAQAYGLMQIIPSTARMIASRIDTFAGGNFKLEALYQPEVNITFGCWYLADLLQKYQNNVIYTLISYNAGENALQKWCSRHDTSDIDEFIEKISYRETRNYVKKVVRNYGLYQRLYRKVPTEASPILAGDNSARRNPVVGN